MADSTLSLPYRPARLPDGAPLDYAPNNEQGVIYLFFSLARRRFGLRVERVQQGFPDCIAYQQEKRVRIEFEYRSKHFLLHKHPTNQCDWIVCWIHDWPDVPSRIRVVELRKEFGLGFNVWLQCAAGKYAHLIGDLRSATWSVSQQAKLGDLLLVYRKRPQACIADVFKLSSDVEYRIARYKPGKNWEADIRLVTRLLAPIHLSDLRNDAVLRNAGFVRADLQGRRKLTEYWPELYRMMVARNPSVRNSLAQFGPDRLS